MIMEIRKWLLIGAGRQRLAGKGHERTFWGDRKCLVISSYMMVTQVYTVAKIHYMERSQCVPSILCKILYISRLN